MKFCATLFLSLLCIVSAADDAKNRPVSKVINVMKDMVAQLEKEAEEDEETYEAFACWCTTNDKEKTKSISDGEQSVSDLTAAIEGFTALSSKLVAEVGNLEQEVAKNTEAMESATSMRRKELKEFNAEEKDTLQTISSLKGAVIALSKHHEASFLQTESRAAVFMQSAQSLVSFHDTMRKSKDIIAQLFTPSQRKVLSAFVQDSQEGLAPASGEIFGMLKQMKETFETNLANSQQEETANQRDYENLKATKDDEIKAGNDQLDKKSEQLAQSDLKNAQSKEGLVDTQNVLEADIKFLTNLKEQCGMMDAEYEERTQTRQMEIQAVGKALSFLNSDEAHDLFSRSFKFVQVSSKQHFEKRRAKIAKLLSHAAHKSNDPQLALLAVRARQDAFGEVKASISEMIDKLVKEKQDEVKKKGYCEVEILQNEHDTEAKTVERNDLEAKIADLKETIHQLSTKIETLKAEVAELSVQVKRAGENREKENKEFQITIADQRATQKLLGAALGILKGFYDKMALVQTGTTEAQEPPPKFKSYEKNAQSGGVMGMMKTIIADSQAVENEAIRGEEDSQKAYEDFVKDSNSSIDAKIKEIVNLSAEKAKAEQDKVEAEQELEAVLGALEQLDNENADLHKECDFTLKNFDIRQTARDDEIEALKQAVAMFSGASFSAFLEMSDPSTDSEWNRDPSQDSQNDRTLDDNDDFIPLLSSYTHN